MAKLKGFDLHSFEEEAFEPLELNRDVARGKALHMGDVHNLVNALDDLGFYDKGRQGKPPLAQESLFKAIEEFQAGNGLTVDGVINRAGPTLERLNQVRSGPTSRQEVDRPEMLDAMSTGRLTEYGRRAMPTEDSRFLIPDRNQRPRIVPKHPANHAAKPDSGLAAPAVPIGMPSIAVFEDFEAPRRQQLGSTFARNSPRVVPAASAAPPETPNAPEEGEFDDLNLEFTAEERAEAANEPIDYDSIALGRLVRWLEEAGLVGHEYADSILFALFGHHFVPRSLFRRWGVPEAARQVLNSATSGRLPWGVHVFDRAHRAYNEAVEELAERHFRAERINPARMTEEQARELLRRVNRSTDPRIRDYSRMIRREAARYRYTRARVNRTLRRTIDSVRNRGRRRP